MTRRGGVGKGTGSKGCRGAEHGQACTKERTGAVAVRAALESAVQVGRGNEGNRQAEMANPTKCRDSLQAPRGPRVACHIPILRQLVLYVARVKVKGESGQRTFVNTYIYLTCFLRQKWILGGNDHY
jgi:hypothetical protein